MKKNTSLRNGFIALMVSCLVLSACKEDIDTSNRYTFLGETIGSFLEKHEDLYEAGSFRRHPCRGRRYALCLGSGCRDYGRLLCGDPL